MRGAIVFFILLFIIFVIYQRFAPVAIQNPLFLTEDEAREEDDEKEEQDQKEQDQKEQDQENVELAATTMAAGLAPAPAPAQPIETKESFQGAPMEACPQPSNPPGKLPTAVYGNISDNAPRPSFDPALEPTTKDRLLTTLDALNGFMNFEGNYLEERSDPQVQLPLGTLKADIQMLTNEALVLQRNPGLRSSITQLQIAEIEANLDFLQQQYRRFDTEGVGMELSS
jgi:hypothetical protein